MKKYFTENAQTYNITFIYIPPAYNIRSGFIIPILLGPEVIEQL